MVLLLMLAMKTSQDCPPVMHMSMSNEYQQLWWHKKSSIHHRGQRNAVTFISECFIFAVKQTRS